MTPIAVFAWCGPNCPSVRITRRRPDGWGIGGVYEKEKRPGGAVPGRRSGFAVVPHTGFEPVISALRGRCPGPLDECGEDRREWYRGFENGGNRGCPKAGSSP